MDNEETPFLKEFAIKRYHQAEGFPVDDVVAREEPLEVRLNGRTLVFLMRLPGDDKLLAAGFCLSEGIVSERGQIELIRHCSDGSGPGDEGAAGPGNLVELTVQLASGTGRFDAARVIRTGCGGADLDREVDLEGINVDSGSRFLPQAITRVPEQLLESQEVFRLTGGTHGAALFDLEGNVLVAREDVGRHNAVDKVLGYLLLSGEAPEDKGLMLSGRLSYEMVLKAARAGIPLLCSVSAPTALGVEVADRTGLTIVGFLRGEGFNVYTHPERIGGE